MRHFAKGTIRWVDVDTWHVLDDAGHRSEGVASVEVTSTSVTIVFDFVADFVITCSVTPDEIFAKKFVTVGASVGLGSAVLRFSMPNVPAVNPKQLSAAGANIWFLFELGSDDPPPTVEC